MEPSPAPGAAPALGEGHHTVVLAGAGHRTLEVTKAGADFRARPLIVALCGPDNERDHRSFAHITADGAGHLWHRFRQDSAVAALVADRTGTAGANCAAAAAGARSPIRTRSSGAWAPGAPASYWPQLLSRPTRDGLRPSPSPSPASGQGPDRAAW